MSDDAPWLYVTSRLHIFLQLLMKILILSYPPEQDCILAVVQCASVGSCFCTWLPLLNQFHPCLSGNLCALSPLVHSASQFLGLTLLTLKNGTEYYTVLGLCLGQLSFEPFSVCIPVLFFFFFCPQSIFSIQTQLQLLQFRGLFSF